MLRRFSFISSFIILFLGALCNQAIASHYRAGEITYTLVSGRTYQITVITYTDPNSLADPNTASIVVSFGDGKSETVGLNSRVPINDYIKKNIYIVNHTYQAEGNYIISLTDQNRVGDIININFGVSEYTAFYVETLLRIDAAIGINRSPVLLVPPIDKGCEGFVYVHNPGAYDPDGDSLTYELITPQQGTGVNVPYYQTPFLTDGGSITLNYTTGELIWNSPQIRGTPSTYNIAIRITEWRGNVKVGYVVRDMQIRIETCVNNPPVIAQMVDYCIEAGKQVQFNVSASDPNSSQKVTLEGFGAPFSMVGNPATLNLPTPPSGNPITGQFTWKTICDNIRYEKYQALIKATDNAAPTSLSDIKFSNIKVIGPAPLNVKVKQEGDGFRISWNHDTCKLATYYKIYKRIDSSHWNPTQCFTGVDHSLFTLLDSVKMPVGNISFDTSYFDNNNGAGLSPLITYCYRIVAMFPPRDVNGNIINSPKYAESYASAEVCGAIVRTKPIITNVSIRQTYTTNGSIFLAWLKPDKLDTTEYLPPYRLVLKRSENQQNYIPFDSIDYTSFSAITDSSRIDTLINTAQKQFFYKIDFISLDAGGYRYIDASPFASSVRASIYPTDRANILSWTFNVPWNNTRYVIYRKNPSDILDSIATTTGNSYFDTGLFNNQNYCYVIKTVGSYSPGLLDRVLENFSQEVCGTPRDTIKPCSPLLTLTPPCDAYNSFYNILSWIPQPGCADDIVYYNIYYKRLSTDPYKLLMGHVPPTATQYIDTSVALKQSIAGCYVVVGVDSFNNEGLFTNEVCTDNCPEYTIPNVFTPEGDNKNDTLHPFPYRFVDKIHLIIYNRWGSPVYETENLDINWDGKDQNSKVECSDGVYFYICDVYEIFLEGVKKRTIRGTIQIIR